MRISFEEEKEKAKKVPDITDRVGKGILSLVLSVEQSQAQTMFDEATEKRLGTARDQHEAAHIYLALGLRQLRNQDVTIRSAGEAVLPTTVFHFAGHAFREIGQLNRAADAYWRAGIANGKNVDEFTIRSLARAKMCYAEIGESDKSDRYAYVGMGSTARADKLFQLGAAHRMAIHNSLRYKCSEVGRVASWGACRLLDPI